MQIRSYLGADNPAIILYPSGTVVTFDDLEARANRLAHRFRQAGLTEGDSIAILMENNEHIHAVMWAARRSGLYYVPINTHLTEAEAAYIIDNSNAKAIIGSAVLRDTCAGLAEHLPNGMPELLLIADGDLPGWDRYPECVANQPDTPIDDEIEGDLLQYSSGTTGRPKGIKRELPHVPPEDAPGMMSALVGFWMDAETVYLSPAPLYHTAPSVWSMTVQGAGITTVVMERFDPEGTLDAIQRHRITHGQFVPAMFVRMLKLPQDVRDSYDLSSLKRVMHAAAPCPVQIKKQMIDWWGPIVDEYYASSEAHGSTLIFAEDWLAHPGSVGKPMAGGVHILDENGNELPSGEAGEIYFEGGHSFEYLNDPTKTAASRHKRGWATVGDIGYLDDEGYLYLTDRRHHMIISGGVNIYPQEAENLLVTHPKVLDAAVFGVPDDEMGQRVVAAVQTVDEADATDQFAEELLLWLRDRLSHFKCPRSIAFEAQLPRTDTGKLYKSGLIEKYSV
ncbi:fatty-acid--CoA ligase FadD4 [Mycobacterium montefiorense]|uniref:Fatty-acid--CoA ligase FadD4 n=1 Tax=Mycobacterium montefiorense TaxID=154654 RepID=A0ABQ0NMD1_9MYCO|nr:fatty-acid--CoA ligase FadD4 [Mycobacterium montefiorense]GBG38020.1 fatty-acid--CoA ligase FadD4 [Mycobacterium montefiorense]GKU33831.1 fatty-acid--CoA ligase FadD4 [Mycobacterium montefiorense]GKU43007.1 fatty-acid--CoA ligase FadD4 [Mycobacterium montefiorense]GKU45404.1 fatty-acid--CoA ligase FadD4 [Mycobacterium montefiorense]GKU49302.1 fatty-acid--CoA ligase FadD4 [Mycobacterium montefiorense]